MATQLAETISCNQHFNLFWLIHLRIYFFYTHLYMSLKVNLKKIILLGDITYSEIEQKWQLM